MSSLHIDHKICTLCERCIRRCPFDALEITGGLLEVTDACVLCGACVKACPEGALSIAGKGAAAPRAKLAEYRGVWVIAERASAYGGEGIHPVTFELIGKAVSLAKTREMDVSVVVLGDDLTRELEQLSHYPVARIYAVSHPQLHRFTSEPWAASLAALIAQEKPETVLAGATALGRDLLPRVAALLDTGLTADCTGLEVDGETGALLQTRPAFGGNIMATIVCPNHRPQMATVRPKVLRELRPVGARDVPVVQYPAPPEAFANSSRVVEIVVDQEPLDNIAEAEVIVAGGRGVGSAKGFDILRELAEALGGSVAASRAAVDAGWLPYAQQVGQTGKTVQPKLYIACGISGSVQHLVGMQSAATIVAINSDLNAPIFRLADYGIVGDLHEIVPRLTEAVRDGRRVRA